MRCLAAMLTAVALGAAARADGRLNVRLIVADEPVPTPDRTHA